MCNNNEILNFIVDEQSSLTRLDKLLCLYCADFSRSKITSLIEEGSVTVNKNVVSKNYKVKQNDVIEIAAMNNRQKKLGYNAARELMQQLGMEDIDAPAK